MSAVAFFGHRSLDKSDSEGGYGTIFDANLKNIINFAVC